MKSKAQKKNLNILVINIIFMARKFINREIELKKIESLLSSNKFEFIVIYGRRRIGKTALLKKAIENKKALYFLCARRNIRYNLRKFSYKVCEFLNIPKAEFGSFLEAFEAILSKEKSPIVVMDEFGYLVEKDEGILSDFQEIVDEILKDTKAKLILCGSYISVMQGRVIGKKSPLYGRNTMQLNLKPLKFEYLFEWFPKIKFEDALKIYAVTSGIPKYLEFFEGKNVEDEIAEKFFDSSSFLYNDAINLLSEELRDYSTYFQILEAIALGYTKITEIGNYAFIEAKDVYFYLKNLRGLGIVERATPILALRKGKRGIYKIRDNYFRFWFKFISEFQEEIESYTQDIAIENFRKKFNTYLGEVFEDLCLELIRNLRFFPFTRIGKWWHKDREIDIVVLNEKTKEVLFTECKWKNKVNAESICKDLAEKAQHVQWHNEKRKESFAIFAKSFSKRVGKFEGRKVYCFDLRDLRHLLK